MKEKKFFATRFIRLVSSRGKWETRILWERTTFEVYTTLNFTYDTKRLYVFGEFFFAANGERKKMYKIYFLCEFLFAVYDDVEYSMQAFQGDTRKKAKSKTQNPKNRESTPKIMKHGIRKLVSCTSLVYTTCSGGGVGGRATHSQCRPIDRKHEWEMIPRWLRIELCEKHEFGINRSLRSCWESSFRWCNKIATFLTRVMLSFT